MYKCTKCLDVRKVVANSKWGADKITLLHLYRSLVQYIVKLKANIDNPAFDFVFRSPE